MATPEHTARKVNHGRLGLSPCTSCADGPCKKGAEVCLEGLSEDLEALMDGFTAYPYSPKFDDGASFEDMAYEEEAQKEVIDLGVTQENVYHANDASLALQSRGRPPCQRRKGSTHS